MAPGIGLLCLLREKIRIPAQAMNRIGNGTLYRGVQLLHPGHNLMPNPVPGILIRQIGAVCHKILMKLRQILFHLFPCNRQERPEESAVSRRNCTQAMQPCPPYQTVHQGFGIV